MEEKTGLAAVSFAAHAMIVRAEQRKTGRYKRAFWFAISLLAATNLCWFLFR